MKGRILSLTIVTSLVMTIGLTSFASTIDDLNKEKNALNSQMQQTEQEKNQIKNQKANEQSELDTINYELINIQNEISELQSKIDELNESIEKKQKEIDAKQKDLEEKQELLKKRLVTLYKKGGISYLDVLLGASDYIEMLSSYDALSRIADADTELINKVSSEKEELESAKKELEVQKAEVDSVKSQKEAKNTELSEKQAQKKLKIATLTQEEKEKQDEIDKYNKAMDDVNKKLEEAFKKAQEQMENNKNNGSDGLKFDGSFIWPCNNKIVTSTVKKRWGRLHKGIDIGASYESVYASATGYAYNAYDRNGYGVYIMVFHGSGYVTLYGHLSKSHVSDGQLVKQGQVIATSGNSGGSTGAHLHFEIRQATSISQFFSKSPLNPLDYLPGGYKLASGATTES